MLVINVLPLLFSVFSILLYTHFLETGNQVFETLQSLDKWIKYISKIRRKKNSNQHCFFIVSDVNCLSVWCM